MTRPARRAAAILFGLLFVSALSLAQSAEKLEAEAKRAFDSGRFKEAAEKYAKAADSADAPADRKGDLYLNSAWAFYIAGSSKSARDNLKAAYSARPDLVVVGDLYSPDFARLAQTVRAEIAGTTPGVGYDQLAVSGVATRWLARADAAIKSAFPAAPADWSSRLVGDETMQQCSAARNSPAKAAADAIQKLGDVDVVVCGLASTDGAAQPERMTAATCSGSAARFSRWISKPS